ncbi:MAG: aminotransferase class V-fold PLP-dependent enzyme [Candidatus Latescibacteria bacterium]|nr:aminotransferase class V-fold PLP-dependent enzyme [Candidatus Latescibacterota bacterium]
MSLDLQRLRRDFPPLQNFVWFQNGGVSITPAPVAEAHAGLMRELFERGPMHIAFPKEEYPRRQQTMARLAHFFSVAPSELALMRGVSEGYQTVLRGLDWQAGDRLLIGADEEAALLLPSLHLRDQCGVEVVKVPLVADAEGQVAEVAKLLDSRTRLVALSHVSTDLGWRLPAEPICRLVREHGALSFLDLAHSAGLYPMKLAELSCDFAGLLSYKWMYGPYAAGALYVRPESVQSLKVVYAGGRAEKWIDFQKNEYELLDGAGRFQYGPWSWPLVHAWAAGLDYLDGIGLEEIWARTVALTSRLKVGLRSIAGLILHTPESPEMSAALVSFGLEGWTGERLCQELRTRWKIVTRPLFHGRVGVRASLSFFLLEEEVDLLIEAVRTLARQG